MRKPRIVFRHFAGSGPLSVYWHAGPYGDAVEALKGRGVAWLAPNAELLGVEFDDVARAADNQTLELPNGDVVHVLVSRGRVSVRLKHGRKKRHAACRASPRRPVPVSWLLDELGRESASTLAGGRRARCAAIASWQSVVQPPNRA